MCMCVYVYKTYIYLYINIFSCTHIHAYTYIHMCVCIYILSVYIYSGRSRYSICMIIRLLMGTAAFVDGYCSTLQGLLDWFGVDLGFTELSFIQIDLCVLCVFVLYYISQFQILHMYDYTLE